MTANQLAVSFKINAFGSNRTGLESGKIFADVIGTAVPSPPTPCLSFWSKGRICSPGDPGPYSY